MKLSTIFVDETKTVRSGWRFLIFILLFQWFITLAVIAAAAMIPSLEFSSGTPTLEFLLMNSLVGGIITLALSWFCLRFLERLPFSSLGLSLSSGWLRDLGVGLALGAMTYGFATGLAAAFGGIRFIPNSEAGATAILSSMGISFAVLLLAAVSEEILFRGYIVQTFARSGYAWPAIVLASAFFGMAHGSNPNVTFIAVLNTVLAGIWFGYAWLRTQSLWLPIGLHFAWNWVQGNLFGVEISGLTFLIAAPLMRESDYGPTWLTGGDYGIEGGIACTVALVAAIGVVGLLKVDGRR